jgi:transposase
VETRAASEQAIKHITLNRGQLRWEAVDLERLIAEDHPARIIWEVSGRFDLRRFEQEHKSKEGEAGRPCWPARLLVSVWVYSYTMGVAGARAIERMLSHEPGLRWLAASEIVNHHTLSDFRVEHKEALEDLFAQFLALLEQAQMVDLSLLLHDGTKVKAVAGSGSLHRRKTLEKRLRQARKVVRELDRRAASEQEPDDKRRQAAQERAAREALERAQAAMEKLRQLEAVTAPSEHKDLRVSLSEAEARKMKQGDGGIAPSYNMQVTTEARSRMIVGIGLSTAGNDIQELLPAIGRVEYYSGQKPATVIADNGYATRSNVEQTTERNIDLIAPWKEDSSREAGACARNGIAAKFAPSKFHVQRGGKQLICPAGKTLVVIQQKIHHGVRKDVFQASESDCGHCGWRKDCCGERQGPRRIERPVESQAMKQYLSRMKRPETRALYRRRSEIAEFPYLWAKAVKKWRRFSVRGLMKAGIEALWVAFAYNIAQWMRLQRAVPAVA